ncbi:MAG TPA: carotenoid oxygenase family protein [Acidimicrobiales bacterium]|nr:carotenoid oxygenase family protein [Acidimicrobiales bacterium]
MSAYLSGNYAPVPDEATVEDLEVEGRLPEALDGRYVRTGPNPVGEAPQPYHWFTGDGMVHGIHLQGGRAVSYRNRWVRTGSAVDGPAQPLYDLSNTNVVPFRGRLLSLTEGCYPYVLAPDLETLGRWDVGAPLPHGLTAHPKVDPETGELHGFAYWFDQPYLLYHVIDADGRLATSTPIELPAPVSMHDFALTRDHVLFFDQPAVFDLEAMATTGFPFSWRPDNGARVGVLPRAGGDIRWYDTELGYCFHPMNAYEDDDGTIVVDVPMQDSVYDRDRVFDRRGPRLERWTIEPSSGKVRQEVVDDAPQEFCRVDDSRLGSPHRYGYTIGVGRDLPYEDTRVYKHDFRTGARDVHDFGPGRHPGEFLFVGDPDRADEEDGGWLLGLVHDDASNRTSLAVLDAQDVPGPPVATVHVPRRIPYGFHGCWMAEA